MSAPDRVIIRSYVPADEAGWLRCRVLAFLETAYFDDVRNEKEQYGNPSIELVAELDGEIVGLLDVECETEPMTVCSRVEEGPQVLAGMIWHVAVNPQKRRLGIAHRLLGEAREQARSRGIARFEAWTREDGFVNAWYRSQGFRQIFSYHHIYPTTEEIRRTGILQSGFKGCHPMSAYCHYLGDDEDFLRQFSRVHECRRYDLVF